MMMSWIYQIMLSEVLGISTTVEGGTGLGDSKYSFYDGEGRYVLPNETYYVSALIEADTHDGDCLRSDRPCGHILPMVFAGGKQDVKPYQGNE